MYGSGGNQVQETADQVQSQKNNVDLWNYYMTTYKPYIDKVIKQDTSNAASTVKGDKAAGQVNAEAMKAASAPPSQPNQPNAVAETKQMTTAAGVDAAATTSARGKVRQRGLSSLQNMVDIGRGKETAAQQSQENIAAQSVGTEAAKKEASLRTEGAYENAVGSLAGAGLAVYGRQLKDPGELYKDAGGDINNVDFGDF